MRVILRFALVIVLALCVSPLRAQRLQGDALLRSLQRGGYVIVMRHASSPQSIPAAGEADPENTQNERQLDEKGRATATEMGRVVRQLKIPVGSVLSSSTYRARETVKYAALGNVTTFPELGDGGLSMQGGTEAQAHWLREHVKQLPSGTNTFIVTHNPNIIAAFPDDGIGLADGEALVFGSDGKDGTAVVARIKIEQWSRLLP
jgi:phosphohistidine phosphatase SixA